MSETLEELWHDIVMCDCGMRKHSVFMSSESGGDVETLRRMNKYSDCCSAPRYLWVIS